MACLTTQDIALGCRDSVGGIKRIYVTELDNKLAITSSAGNITAFTLASTKQFWIYDMEKENGEFNKKINTSADGAGTLFYEYEVKVRFNKMTATLAQEFHLLAQNRLMVIVLDRNGLYWLVGEVNGADLAPSTGTAGKAFGDFNGYELTFMAKETSPANTVASNLITALTTAAS